MVGRRQAVGDHRLGPVAELEHGLGRDVVFFGPKLLGQLVRQLDAAVVGGHRHDQFVGRCDVGGQRGDVVGDRLGPGLNHQRHHAVTHPVVVGQRFAIRHLFQQRRLLVDVTPPDRTRQQPADDGRLTLDSPPQRFELRLGRQDLVAPQQRRRLVEPLRPLDAVRSRRRVRDAFQVQTDLRRTVHATQDLQCRLPALVTVGDHRQRRVDTGRQIISAAEQRVRQHRRDVQHEAVDGLARFGQRLQQTLGGFVDVAGEDLGGPSLGQGGRVVRLQADEAVGVLGQRFVLAQVHQQPAADRQHPRGLRVLFEDRLHPVHRRDDLPALDHLQDLVHFVDAVLAFAELDLLAAAARAGGVQVDGHDRPRGFGFGEDFRAGSVARGCRTHRPSPGPGGARGVGGAVDLSFVICHSSFVM